MAAGAGLAVDGFAEAQPLGRGGPGDKRTRLKRMPATERIEAGGKRSPVALRERGTQRRRCRSRRAGAAQQQGKGGQRAGEPRPQSFAVFRGFGIRLQAAQVARHHHQLGSQSPLMLALRRGRGGTHRRGREGEDAKQSHAQLSLTFCSTPPPLSMVHSIIEPSYMRAFLLPISSLETNQPTEAQWPELQKLICSPLVGTPATL